MNEKTTPEKTKTGFTISTHDGVLRVWRIGDTVTVDTGEDRLDMGLREADFLTRHLTKLIYPKPLGTSYPSEP